MYPRRACLFVVAVAALLISSPRGFAAEDSVTDLQERVFKSAVARVAPSVVQIETTGGTDVLSLGPLGATDRKGTGPTTGLAVSPDGYIISSAFNFVNKPTSITVQVPGHAKHYVAKIVANDHTRMLTLLKINLNEDPKAKSAPLPVATPAPKASLKVGQTVIAVGRTWSGPNGIPSVSVGIVSALGRIWGKAVQTDAKVSPVNYGGPLVDVEGRVIGVLVPASPQGNDETAGHEWYDSGIGFAIPLEDVNAVLPRLKEGKDLQRGYLGVVPQSPDIYSIAPVVASVQPGSAAAVVGIRPNDTLLEISGVKVFRQAQVMHLLGAKYEGDVVSVKVKRGNQELDFPTVKLTGLGAAFPQPFIGFIPLRDDPELGVEVRYVYPSSPAEKAGLKAGDRVMSLGQGKETPRAFSGRDELVNLLAAVPPGAEVQVEVRRPGAKDLVTLKFSLGEPPDVIPEQLPENRSLKKALAPRKAAAPMQPMAQAPKPEEDKRPASKKKPEVGLMKHRNAAGDHQYWVFVPSNYDPNIAHALVVWLHPPGKNKDRDVEAMVDAWETPCEDNHLILLVPKAENDTGWLASEADFIRETVNLVAGPYSVDRQRIVAHGMDMGGQMAFYLGFHARDLFRGVATTGSALTSQPTESAANQRLSFFVVAGTRDPLARAIAEIKPKLAAKKYPVAYREIKDMGHQYLDQKTLDELVRWIDSLDRL